MASFFNIGAIAQTNASQRRQANRQRRAQAAIQETYTHKFEVTLGGGYLRFRPGPQLRHINEIAWNVAGTRYFNERFGLTADFRGYYGTAHPFPNEFALFNNGIREYVYQAGPTYRIYAKQKFAVSARVLAGASTGVFDVSTNHIPPQNVGIYPVATVFAANIGAPLDYNIDPALAIRVTPEFEITHFGGQTQFNKGISFGIVYRFGHQ
jgi:hypothetical protein